MDGPERSLEVDKAVAATQLWSRDYAGAIERFDAILAREPDHIYANIMRVMAAVYARDVPAGATASLARSFAQHESVCSLGAVDPSYDRVRGAAGFRAVVRSMGVPE